MQNCSVNQSALLSRFRKDLSHQYQSINQSINQSIILFSNADYIKAALRLMWTYNELIKCETEIIYKITLWYLNIEYESLK